MSLQTPGDLSAVRNMDRARISQPVAILIFGHKTASVYRRYRIVPESDLREALQAVQASVRGIGTAKVSVLAEARGKGA